MSAEHRPAIPFLRERDAEGRYVHPPLHLRPWTVEEIEQHRRMIREQERAAAHYRRLREKEEQP